MGPQSLLVGRIGRWGVLITTLAAVVCGCQPARPQGELSLLSPTLSVHAVDVATHEEVTRVDPTAARQGGSTTKILTAAAALDRLGPERRVATRVAVTPDGEYVLVGGADPTLRPDALSALAGQTAAHAQRVGRSAVSIGYDSTAVTVPPSAGWSTEYVADIEPAGLLLRTDDGVLRDREVAAEFARLVAAAGVTATLAGPQDAGVPLEPVATHQGPTVAELTSDMLKNSDSLIAESLFALMHETDHAPGQPLVHALEQAGVDTTGLVLDDGSGVSAQTRITAAALTQVLLKARDDPDWRPIADGLPVAGEDGTLGPETGRFLTPATSCAVGRLRAKTGSLTGVVALAGYAPSNDSERVLALILNDIPTEIPVDEVRAAVDRAAVALMGCGQTSRG